MLALPALASAMICGVTDDLALIFRPALGWRICCWCIAMFGALFGLSALAGNDLGGEIAMGAAGLVFALVGIATATARAKCTRHGLTIRSLRSRFVPSTEVTSVDVSDTDFGYGQRVRIVIRRRGGRSLKPSALTRYDTKRNRERANADAEAIRCALGLTTLNSDA